ncbi:restriction endonuclease [Leptospira perdikensis]|uniref:Restriction endonuclease n=1 Tax=Leptospira perdikensis TaxID=2484948 RepID=A0A4R9JKH2_9LEPT|nr:restriction endonuclease [Leptospira perdikensis]TGL45996.1 restriction endonuclease [Leptospira perdikensis]
MTNTGKDYELFVKSLQQAILNSESVATQKNIVIEVNKKLIDDCQIEREFDLYWEYELGGLIYKTIIECKDYNSKISVDKIDALIGKVRDLPDIKAVFATKQGYQSGAQKKAARNKIELLIVREQNDTDWRDSEGRPLIKKIIINMFICLPASINHFLPTVDSKWLEENNKQNIDSSFSLTGLDKDIIIEDIGRSDKYSLYDLSYRLSNIDGKRIGTFEEPINFDNAFLIYKELKLKIKSILLNYSIHKPIENPIEIDFSKELEGVIEYLERGKKKTIFKNGKIRNF